MTAEALDSGSQTMDVRWEGLAAVRAAHLGLRRSTADAAPDDKRRHIEDFLDAASKAGAFIAGINDRRDAQNILDYWCFELASLRQSGTDPAADLSHFVPKMLAPFDASRASEPERAVARSTDEQRELIRLSAQARQYVNSGGYKGYLLGGAAIGRAARFSNVDNNIALLVEKSQTAAEHKRYFLAGNFTFMALLVGALGVIVLIYYAINIWADAIVTRVQAGTDSTATRIVGSLAGPKAADALDLRLLALFQPWTQPYDLSGTPKFAAIELPGLQLHAPNFAGTNFRNVVFRGAKLPAASFSESTFRFDGLEGRNDFSEAGLARTQFRSADVAFTSFHGSDLYRAVFDRAVLCDVDFSGANLRSASFWATKIDRETRNSLKTKAPWWLALGWDWDKIKLLTPSMDEAPETAEDIKEALSAIRNSQGFQKDLGEPKAAFERSSPGSLEQARALNDIAWIYAVWGWCISEADGRWHPEPCTTELPTGFPKSALEAARRAVDTAKKLSDPAAGKGLSAEFVARQQDTLAYVLMQSGKMQDAVNEFADISRTSPTVAEAGETSFRYAIAQYDLARSGDDHAAERDNAVKLFEKAIFERRYQPSHELKTLDRYIFRIPRFERPLERSFKALWPTGEDPGSDQTGSRPGAANEPNCPKREAAKAG